MFKSQIAPFLLLFLISWTLVDCQYYNEPSFPYGLPPYFDPQYDPYPPIPPEGAPFPQGSYPPPPLLSSPFNNLNPFLPNSGQNQNQNQNQKQQQQVQGSYPNANLPQFPFQTVTPGNGGISNTQRVDRYPFTGNSFGNNLNTNSIQSTPLYPNLPSLPFQTITPGAGQIDPTLLALFQNLQNQNQNQNYLKPKIELPKIRVIEFPSSEYFEYGGGKLVQPKRPNADLYVGGSGGDVPITSKVFIECTGPNQVEWLFSGNNATKDKKELSVVTKNFQITIPDHRGPPPGSREYTYLRLGLEDQISAKDSGVYTCRDRVLPQNYITIRVIVASMQRQSQPEQPQYSVFSGGQGQPQTFGVGPSFPFTFGTTSFGNEMGMRLGGNFGGVGEPVTGRPNYPFRPSPSPRDPNTIYYTDSDSTVVLPCKIENADATISLHKHEMGKLSCPYTMDGRVLYDRFRGFIIQTRVFQDLEGRYVCVGDFGGELKLMKYKLVRNNDFTTRYVEGVQNIVALESKKTDATTSANTASGSGSASSFLDKVDSFPNSILSGLTTSELSNLNLTALGLLDPRSEFQIETQEQSSSSGLNLSQLQSQKKTNDALSKKENEKNSKPK